METPPTHSRSAPSCRSRVRWLTIARPTSPPFRRAGGVNGPAKARSAVILSSSTQHVDRPDVLRLRNVLGHPFVALARRLRPPTDDAVEGDDLVPGVFVAFVV